MATRKAPPRVEIAHFDTDLFDSGDRFDAWNQNMGVLFDLLAPDGSVPKHDMSARIDVCNLGDAVFGVTRAQSQLFSRNDRRVARDDLDHILVQVFLEGGGLASSDHRIQAGDMLIIDLDQPHEMLNTDFANLTMVLPRELHPALSDLLSVFHGRRLGQDNPMVPFVAWPNSCPPKRWPRPSAFPAPSSTVSSHPTTALRVISWNGACGAACTCCRTRRTAT